MFAVRFIGGSYPMCSRDVQPPLRSRACLFSFGSTCRGVHLTSVRGLLARYTDWLHTRWPAGTVERLPVSGDRWRNQHAGRADRRRSDRDSAAQVLVEDRRRRGARDSARSQSLPTRSAERRTRKSWISRSSAAGLPDLGGDRSEESGASLRRHRGDRARSRRCINFPKGKPIYTYPTAMKLEGGLQFSATVKEELVARWKRSGATRASR